MKKINIILAAFALSFGLHAQSLILDAESGNRGAEQAQCWAFGAVGYVNSANDVVNGSFSMRGNSASNPNPDACWIKSPWIKPGSGNISINVRFNSTNGIGTDKRIILSYKSYDANSASSSKEGALVRFDSVVYTSMFITPVGLSFPIPAAIANSNDPYKIQVSLVGVGGNARWIVDDLVIPGTYFADPANGCLPQGLIIDTDGDGVDDNNDDYPNDATRAYNNYFPGGPNDFGSLAFEDLWPAKGDFDFNDVVIDFNVNEVTNASNNVVEMKIRGYVRAVGAAFRNGFALSFDNLSPNAIASVTGNSITDNYITLNPNGTEAGQSKAVVILFDDTESIINRAGGPTHNTTAGFPTGTADSLNITITFAQPVSWDNAEANPFLIKNRQRGFEIHMPYAKPTDLADPTQFGRLDDDSNPGQNRYYVTENNLPWVIITPTKFQYPLEKVDIVEAYPNIVPWALSDGNSNDDWFLDLPGNIIQNKVY